MGANQAGAWAVSSTGLEFRYIASQNKTYITQEDGTQEVHEGRFGF
jgi:hypothetical protein